MSDALLGLQQWYESQCNGDWEHQYGISIESQDNPGWRVEIDLKETRFAGIPFQRLEERDATRWLLCWIEKDKFIGAGDPTQLSEIIRRFLVWTGSW